MYWKQLVQLKVSCEYIRRYRGKVLAWTTGFAVIRAVASSTAIGAWAAFQTLPFLWAGIIAAAQVADALQRAIPFSRRAQGTSALVIIFDALFIEAQMEWENVVSGSMTQAAINRRRGRLMKLQLDAEAKHFPNGLPLRADLFRLAEADALAYMSHTFDARQTG